MKAFGIEIVKRVCAKVKVFKLSIKPNFAQKQPRHNQGKRKKIQELGKASVTTHRNCVVELQKEESPKSQMGACVWKHAGQGEKYFQVPCPQLKRGAHSSPSIDSGREQGTLASFSKYITIHL